MTDVYVFASRRAAVSAEARIFARLVRLSRKLGTVRPDGSILGKDRRGRLARKGRGTVRYAQVRQVPGRRQWFIKVPDARLRGAVKGAVVRPLPKEWLKSDDPE